MKKLIFLLVFTCFMVSIMPAQSNGSKPKAPTGSTVYEISNNPNLPDLTLSTSVVSKELKTNQQGVVLIFYNLTCTVKNIGKGTAILNKNLSVSRLQSTTFCDDYSLSPSISGDNVGDSLTQILPGETVVFKDVHVFQNYAHATTSKLVLHYESPEVTTTNNFDCFEP
jgi:hypothetical protein